MPKDTVSHALLLALHVQVMGKGSVKRTLLHEYFFPFQDIGSDLCHYFTNCTS